VRPRGGDGAHRGDPLVPRTGRAGARPGARPPGLLHARLAALVTGPGNRPPQHRTPRPRHKPCPPHTQRPPHPVPPPPPHLRTSAPDTGHSAPPLTSGTKPPSVERPRSTWNTMVAVWNEPTPKPPRVERSCATTFHTEGWGRPGRPGLLTRWGQLGQPGLLTGWGQLGRPRDLSLPGRGQRMSHARPSVAGQGGVAPAGPLVHRRVDLEHLPRDRVPPAHREHPA